jgi:hypothetical protein
MKPFELIERQSDKFQYTSIERVKEMIYRDYKFIQDVKTSDMLEWIGAIYGFLSVPGMFRKKVTGVDLLTPNIVVSQYRGTLPVDFRKVLKAGIRDYDTKEVYRKSLGTFTQFQHGLDEDANNANVDKLYNISGGYIFVEDEVATLEMCYESFPIDDRGYPLIPDEQKVLEYAKEYIAEKITFNLYAAGKVSKDIWDTIEKRRMWRAGAAHSSLIRPDVDTMESWTWARLKLMPRIMDHETSFSYFGSREDLNIGTE